MKEINLILDFAQEAPSVIAQVTSQTQSKMSMLFLGRIERHRIAINDLFNRGLLHEGTRKALLEKCGRMIVLHVNQNNDFTEVNLTLKV